MAIANEQDGSQTCTISTEHTLNTGSDPTGAKTRAVRLDLNAAALGDTFELRVKTKVRTGDTVREQFLFTFTHSRGQPIVETPPLLSVFGCTVTLKQTTGTGRAVPWSIVTLD